MTALLGAILGCPPPVTDFPRRAAGSIEAWDREITRNSHFSGEWERRKRDAMWLTAMCRPMPLVPTRTFLLALHDEEYDSAAVVRACYGAVFDHWRIEEAPRGAPGAVIMDTSSLRAAASTLGVLAPNPWDWGGWWRVSEPAPAFDIVGTSSRWHFPEPAFRLVAEDGQGELPADEAPGILLSPLRPARLRESTMMEPATALQVHEDWWMLCTSASLNRVPLWRCDASGCQVANRVPLDDLSIEQRILAVDFEGSRVSCAAATSVSNPGSVRDLREAVHRHLVAPVAPDWQGAERRTEAPTAFWGPIPLHGGR